jgi:hypothetical protein
MANAAEITNIAVLGNACHLVSEIVLAVAGNEISNHLNGKEIDKTTVNGIALAAINRELSGVVA